MSYDRAAVFTTIITNILADALRGWARGSEVSMKDVRAEIESLVREEFADIEAQARNDRKLID